MYQVTHFDREAFKKEAAVPNQYTSYLSYRKVRLTMLLNWGEHCIECAVPECYKTCSIFQDRGDGNCRRFSYGIAFHKQFQGLFKFGADVRFKRWAKMEAFVSPYCATPFEHRLLQCIHSTCMPILKKSFFLQMLNLTRRIVRKLGWVFVTRFGVIKNYDWDEFVMEVISLEDKPFRLIFESHTDDGRAPFRDSFEIKSGPNFYTIPAKRFQVDSNLKISKNRILFYPENDNEVRVIFTWLDFVKYKKKIKAANLGLSDMNREVAGQSSVVRFQDAWRLHQLESKRDEIRTSFVGSEESFVKDSDLQLRIFRPSTDWDIIRCLAVIQRGDMLNASLRSYTRAEFSILLESKENVCLALSLKDKFGDFGIVGFANIEISDKFIEVKDFTLACRAASRQIERAFFEWLSLSRKSEIQMLFRHSSKNAHLYTELIGCGFIIEEKSKMTSLLKKAYFSESVEVSAGSVKVTAEL